MSALLPFDDAFARLLSHADTLPGTETIDTMNADGRVLARALVSSLDVPPWDNAQMDGYAVRAADLAASPDGVFPVSQRIPAGHQGQPLQPGTVARIFTGAALPPGGAAPPARPGWTPRGDGGELGAPVKAVVRSRLLEPGDMASPQRPVLALAVTTPKWARIYVDESSLGQVKPGQAAQLSVDSMPGRTLAGKIGYISSVAEFTPKSVQTEVLRTSLVYEVRVLVDDPDDALRLGQPVTVRLESGTADRNHEAG